MSNHHEANCSCPICNNGIREEQQYAEMQLGERWFFVDASEAVMLEDFLRNKDKGAEQPVLSKEEPDETKIPVLAYGVLMPQTESGIKNWTEEVSKWKNYFFGSVEDEKLKLSCYKDFKLFENHIVYGKNIPCALLLHTTLDLTKERGYGFGYTAFLIYRNLGILDNIINRDFLFCLSGIEENFDGENLENWQQQIDEEKLMEITRRLF